MPPLASSFRLGATSYVYPGDLVHNAARLAGQVQDMELVLWVAATGANNLPTDAEIAALAHIGAQHGLTYTVHLPRDLGGADGAAALALAQCVIASCAPLAPYAYVMHIDTQGAGSAAWRAQALAALAQVAAWAGNPQQIALENLESYPPEHLLPLFAELPIARTLDIGHLWKAGIDPLPVIDAWRAHARVMHIHGVRRQGAVREDHGTLAWMAPSAIAEVVARLQGWQGVLTLEVFENDYFSSRTAFDDALAAAHAQPMNGCTHGSDPSV